MELLNLPYFCLLQRLCPVWIVFGQLRSTPGIPLILIIYYPPNFQIIQNTLILHHKKCNCRILAHFCRRWLENPRCLDSLVKASEDLVKII